MLKTLKYPLFIGIAIGFFQQATGINAIIFYSNKIFRESGSSEDLLTLFTVIVNITQVGATFGTGFVIEKFGRKLLFMIGFGICVFALAFTILAIWLRLN